MAEMLYLGMKAHKNSIAGTAVYYDTTHGRCIGGTETVMARLRSPSPYPGLRGGAAGDSGGPDGDLLGLKGDGRARLGAEGMGI